MLWLKNVFNLMYRKIERICLANGTWSNDAPICAVDVAHGKPAEQSSGTTANHAVDSNTLCAITDHSKSSWWQVIIRLFV
ncbi:unnamed protein product [Enterobius vermicularis]|uniref:Sushi domain-containing protein n=1 Tax=Enterobius vermicularis TaxID=51028 RepID=A0A0N4VQW2_ENTVE|nr:unnamed protein product [Enterobius vermicularis]